MNEKNDIEKRLEELGHALDTGGSIVDKVMQRIDSAAVAKPQPRSAPTIFILRRFGKLAVAAVLLILAGYAGARFSGPGVDVDQLSATVTDSIRANLAQEMTEQWRAELATSYLQLKEELNQQHQKDLNSFALQTLAVSSTATNQLLTELIQSISAAQAQDRQWIMAALNKVESNRLADTAQFRNGLQSLAVLTGNEFERTHQDMVQLLVDKQGGSLVPQK
jgi:cell division septum initiation protein DivIVA